MPVGILFQPTEIVADGTPNFGVFAGKPRCYALRVFGTKDISTDFDFDLY